GMLRTILNICGKKRALLSSIFSQQFIGASGGMTFGGKEVPEDIHQRGVRCSYQAWRRTACSVDNGGMSAGFT
ncbi:MAG: hypothetical protein ACREIP_04520, partial [Alphaproteobacteria bacterium]